jgi:hypothetical protein
VEKPNSLATVAGWTFVGGLVGTGVGAAVGGINGNTTSHEWGKDLGTGALIGLGVGAVTGGVVAFIDYNDWQHHKVAVAPMTGSGGTGLAVAGRW